jgi:predicted enzyme related to lactoylglutathione lyase
MNLVRSSGVSRLHVVPPDSPPRSALAAQRGGTSSQIHRLKLRNGKHNPSWLPTGLLACRLAGLLSLASTTLMAAELVSLPPLTTAPGSPRLPGKFVWADLVTDDVAGAREFYGHLFGWTFRDAGSYVIAANDERALCGMFQQRRPAGRPDARPRWFGYISVDNIEKALRAVTKAGGSVIAAPRNLPKRGEQAIFADPEGALFGVLKSSSGDPHDFLAEPGDWIWIQLLSRNAKKAAPFYRSVGGYDVVENTSSNRLSDYVLTSEGYARATVRTIPRHRGDVQPNWLPFVRVKSVNESVALAKQLGGKVALEPKPELFGGRVAVITDPAGAAIGLLEWSDELLKGGQ